MQPVLSRLEFQHAADRCGCGSELRSQYYPDWRFSTHLIDVAVIDVAVFVSYAASIVQTGVDVTHNSVLRLL